MTKANTEEIKNFESMADQWWDEDGPSKPLHKLNPTRIRYITSQIHTHFRKDTIEDLKILDVGCGGGLVCEPLCRLGADVTGIDAGHIAIDTAINHAVDNNLKITYKCETADKHEGQYDVILALEILEHLDDRDQFIADIKKLLKPKGMIIFSTLNRTPKSFALGIVAAEYIVRWVPRGTHNWKKFIKPSELARSVKNNALQVQDITGLIYNPFTDQFTLSQGDIDVNYFMSIST